MRTASRIALLFTNCLIAATLLAAVVTPGTSMPGPPQSAASGSSSRAVFERRILPIFASKNASTCSECHLSGVDLKSYIRPTEADTFAALRQQGMLDLKQPDNSRILQFIKKARPKTPLLTQKARETEYAAFRDWIVAAASNRGLASARPSSVRVGPEVPTPVIRHTRLDSVVASFERNIWSQEGRCMGCHRPDNAANVKKYGERVRWYVPDSPEATMQRLIAQGDINVDRPEESLLLLKPLNKVKHGGGIKMLYGDVGYKQFRGWIEDYAASVKGKYRAAGQLPADPRLAYVNMNSILGISDGPPQWAGQHSQP